MKSTNARASPTDMTLCKRGTKFHYVNDQRETLIMWFSGGRLHQEKIPQPQVWEVIRSLKRQGFPVTRVNSTCQ